jgi:histidinol-phosphate aminotransferase
VATSERARVHRRAPHPAGPAAPAGRPAVAGLPAYRPGRSAADAMADHGIATATKLASNELPWGPLPSVARALAEAAGSVQLYPDARAAALRERIASVVGTEPAGVTVGPGAVGLLQQLAVAFVDPGDQVVRGEPSFEAYPIFTRLAGGTDVAVPAVDERLDLPAMAAAVTARTTMVLVADPNNPTGTAVAASQVRDLVDAVPPSCLVVLDGAYHEFRDDPSIDDAMALARQRPNVVALRTFSKAHGLAALRVGYAVGHPDVIAALDKVLIPFAVGALGQVAALASLAAGDDVAARVAVLRAERARVIDELAELGWAVPPSATNFVWLSCGPAARAVASDLERAGIVARAFDGVGVRVTVGAGADNDRFLAALAGIAKP